MPQPNELRHAVKGAPEQPKAGLEQAHLAGGPGVRIRFPPAASQQRTMRMPGNSVSGQIEWRTVAGPFVGACV
jgi:hypothetical protein